VSDSILASSVPGCSDGLVEFGVEENLDELSELGLDPFRQEILSENFWKAYCNRRRLAHGVSLQSWPR
jgi:hypothetical protein